MVNEKWRRLEGGGRKERGREAGLGSGLTILV